MLINRLVVINFLMSIAFMGILIYMFLCIEKLLEITEGNQVEVNKQLKSFETKLSDTEHDLSKLQGSFVILDNAINSNSKRKARINKVKEVIKNTAIREGLLVAQQLKPSELAEMATAIVDRADEEHIPVALLLALARQESAFNPNAVSRTGAEGLTQVMPTTADDIKQWTNRSYYEPFRISHNIMFGAYYLGRMLRKFNWNETHAVWAYNGGPEAVARHLAEERPLAKETVEYEIRVMGFKKKFESLGVF